MIGDHAGAQDSPLAPRVTVILPTFRRPDLLGRAMEAVFGQTFVDWELIIVDDNGRGSGMQVQTEAIVRAYAGKERLHYLVHETNQGGGAARNTGIAAARGEFVAFLDDDDTWEPEKLELQLACFEENDDDVALVYCRSKIVNELAGTVSVRPIDGRSHTVEDLLQRNTVGSTSLVLCRRDALREIGGFDPRLPAKQDIDLYIRLAQRYEFAFVDRVLYTGYRHAGESIGKNLAGAIRAHEVFHEKHAALIEKHPDVHRYRLAAIGKLYLAGGRRVDARRAFWHAWRLNPLRVGLALQLAASFLPSSILTSLGPHLRRSRSDHRAPEDGS